MHSGWNVGALFHHHNAIFDRIVFKVAIGQMLATDDFHIIANPAVFIDDCDNILCWYLPEVLSVALQVRLCP